MTFTCSLPITCTRRNETEKACYVAHLFLVRISMTSILCFSIAITMTVSCLSITGAVALFMFIAASSKSAKQRYSGDLSNPPTLTCVVWNDDADNCPSRFASRVSFSVEAGKTYWVLVGGFDDFSGSFVLSATCTPASRIPLPCGTTTGDTSSPPAQLYNLPDCPVPVTQPGILYELDPVPLAESVTLTTCNGGTLFDTIISVYSPSTQCYTGNDDTSSSLCSTVKFNIDQADTYTILVHGAPPGSSS